MNKRILITADIHYERIPKDQRISFLRYLISSIDEFLPDIFIIAGDTVDSRNLRAESDDFKEVSEFVNSLADNCVKRGTTFIVLRGTPSHDGDVMQNITSFMGNKVIYIDKICSKFIQDLAIGFIPELYYAKYEDFLKDMESEIKFSQDIIVFHGMMNFAIPAVKQIDSRWDLHKNLVMNYKDVENYAKTIVIGGHVHEFMSKGITYYTGRAISNVGEVTENRVFGLQLVDIDNKNNKFELKSIINKDVPLIRKVTVDLINDDIRELINHFKSFNVDELKFIFLVDSNESTVNKQKEFMEVIKPKYYQVKHKVEVKEVIKMETGVIEDIDALVHEFYKKKTNLDIPESLCKEIDLKMKE